MPIKNLTDNVIPRFPRLGKLRKGGEKPPTGNKPGAELSYFRFTSENPAIVEAFHEAYGTQPAMLRVYLPYPSTEMNFSTWKEAWGAGGLMHRCDGENCTIWRTPDGKYSQTPKPCPGGCKEVGRLEVILPELITAGFVGYVTLETHSLHDLMNITATLEAVRQSAQDRPNGLQGIEFVLRRKKERISTPDGKGGRTSREKWLVSIEPVPSWAQTYLAMASSTLAIEAPRVDMLTGEILDDDEDDEAGDVVEGTATEVKQEVATFRNTARPWSADMAIDAIRSQANIDDGKPVDEGLWGALVGTLDSAPFNTQMRHELVGQIFGVQTTKDLNPAQRKAMLKWSKIAKSGPEKSDPWAIDGNALTEYKHIVGSLWVEQPASAGSEPDPDWQAIEAAGVEAPKF